MKFIFKEIKKYLVADPSVTTILLALRNKVLSGVVFGHVVASGSSKIGVLAVSTNLKA